MRLHFLRYVAVGLLVRLLLGAAPANAQAPSFGTVLTVGAGSTGTVQVGKMTSDAQGNRYFAGSFRGTVTFGSTTLSSPNTSDIFVAKLNGAGAYQWVVQAGGADNDSGGSVAVDATGSVYVTGTYIGPATFGLLAVASVTPVPFGYTDAFVARLDGAGNWLWVRTGGGNRSDGAGPVVLDASGNAYVGLFFGGATAQFGPFSVANADGPTSTTSDVVIAKLDPAGTWRWARSAGSGGYDWVSRLALDDAGHLFAYGSFEGNSLGLGNLTIRNSGSGSNDVYIAQLDTAGTWRWARDAGGTFIDLDGGMALDWAGNAYIAGYFRSPSMSFGTLNLPSHSGTSQIGELFVAKIDNAGNWVWARASGSASNVIGDLAVSSGAEIAVTGSFSGSTLQLGATGFANSSAFVNPQYRADAFLARLDPKGNWLDGTSSQGPGDETAQALAYDASGNFLITGTFQGASATFGAITLPGSTSVSTGYLGFVPGGAPPTRVTGLVPGAAAPGQPLTVSGSGFVGATAVLFNGTPATSFAVQSATQLTVVVPADATAGPISVRTAAGTGSSSTVFRPMALATAAPRAAGLALYPNPAASLVYLSASLAGSRVQVLDALGRTVRETTVSSAGEVSVRDLPPGLYTLRASDVQGRQYAARVTVE